MIRASISSNTLLKAARLSLFAAAGCLSIAGCADESVPVDAEDAEVSADAVMPLTSSVELGIMTGGYYSTGTTPYLQNAEQTMGDFRRLGAKWVRMEANFGGNTPDEGMRRLVEKAHLRGLKVVMLLQGQYCVAPVDWTTGRCSGAFSGRDDDHAAEDSFINSYIYGPKGLNYYATSVFNTDLSRPDAYEILNEPNICVDPDNSKCTAWQGKLGLRVGGDTAARLLRGVWDWKRQNSRSELIVSGGALNTYTVETAFWERFFAADAWQSWKERPFDYFGIHPYNSNWLGTDGGACINGGGSGCFDKVMNGDSWVSRTVGLINGLRQRVQALPGVGTNWGFFATEFGWRVGYGGCSVPNTNGCVSNEPQQAEGLDASVRALQQSGVAAATYNEYRDFVGGNYGLYGSDGVNWHIKPSYTKFSQLAGGSGLNDAWSSRYSDSISPFDTYVEALSSSGAIEGCDSVGVGNFRPVGCLDSADRFSFGTNLSAKRGVVAAWTVRAANLPFDASGAAHFNDVPPSHPYYREIETAVRRGIISGYGCGAAGEPCPGAYFRPNNDVTRGQTAKIIANAHGWPQVQSATPTFADVPIGSTFYGYVEACAQRGIIGGYSCGAVGEPCPGTYFRPNNSVTRGQLTKIVYLAGQ